MRYAYNVWSHLALKDDSQFQTAVFGTQCGPERNNVVVQRVNDMVSINYQYLCYYKRSGLLLCCGG